MRFLHLFERFVLRALLREKVRSVVAALGIALGVAVMLAVRLANSSVTDTFRAAVDSVSGNASLRIRGAAGRFDELLLKEIEWVPAYGQISPVIETYAMLGGPPSTAGQQGLTRGELLHVLGVDVLLDFPLRDYHVLRTAESTERRSAPESLRLLDDAHAVILTEKFLRRHDLRVGDEIPLTFGSREQMFTIRGVLLDRGPARTLDGNFALMDIAAAQLAADRIGLLDHVDVMLPEGQDVQQLLAEIRDRLPVGLVVEFPAAASGRADTMVAAFQFNLTALSGVGLIVGLFLIYNTVSLSVASRRTEVGMLLAVGARRQTVLLLFLCEALLLTIVGVAIGLPAGRYLARAAVRATAQTVETFYIAAVAQASAGGLRLGLSEMLWSTALALPFGLLAAWVPAWEAASVQPVEAVRGLGTRMAPSRIRQLACGAAFCLGLAWLLTWGPPLAGRPVWGFLAGIALMLGGALFTPALLWLACAGAPKSDRRWRPAGPVEWRIARANLLGALPRVSVSVAALAVSLSMMMAISVMVGSFRETVVYWLDSALSADLSVKPVMQTSSVSEARLSRETCARILADPDVVETVWFSSRQISLGNRDIRLAVTELRKTIGNGRLLFKSPPPDFALPASPADAVLISESYSLLFDVGVGDVIQLPTATGSASLHVAGVYYDYASNQGTVMMDQDTYRRYYGRSDPSIRPQHVSVYLRPTADPTAVRRRILERLGDREQVYCITNREVRDEAMRIFESTFTVTYALQLIAIIVAGLGVASTLITMIYQRQREIGLLSLVGASGRQIRRVMVWEAVLLGGVSQLIGIGLGILLALVLIFVINVQSFGWTIQFHLPWWFLLQSTVLVIAGSALFGLYPAVRAAGIDALQTVRDEYA